MALDSQQVLEGEASRDSLATAADLLRWRQLDLPPRLDPGVTTRLLAAALQRAGSSTLRLLVGALRGPGRLTLDEVFYYRLLDGDLDEAAVRCFIGKRRQVAFHVLCNALDWRAAASDKALFYTLMSGAGLPVPQTLAILGSAPRVGYRSLVPGGLADFLRGNDCWPLFAKPVGGMYSIGAMRLAGFDESAVEVAGLGPVPVPELERYMADLSKDGYMLQACLRPSTFAAQHLHGGLPSVRLLILLDGADFRVESAILKIPGPGAIADNYWRAGNAIAALDAETGMMLRVVTGTGPTMKVIESHPVTGHAFAGLALPGWDEIVDLGCAAASALPGIRTQSWDIALTDAGPVLLEVNWGGDLNLHQLAHRRGALTNRYCAHLRRAGWSQSLPA